jgi:hypothetical protein
VTYYGHFGGTKQLPSNDLVEISCYYLGSPVVHRDNVEDHVVALATPSGPTPLNGHVPDWKSTSAATTPGRKAFPPAEHRFPSGRGHSEAGLSTCGYATIPPVP